MIDAHRRLKCLREERAEHDEHLREVINETAVRLQELSRTAARCAESVRQELMTPDAAVASIEAACALLANTGYRYGQCIANIAALDDEMKGAIQEAADDTLAG